MGMAAGIPFLVAGGLKAAYDVALYLTFRRVRLADHSSVEGSAVMGADPRCQMCVGRTLGDAGPSQVSSKSRC
jgi:hypothetical protein